MAGFLLNEAVGRVAGRFERNRTFSACQTRLVGVTAHAVLRAQVFGDFEPVDCATFFPIGGQGSRQLLMFLGVASRPFGMIERDAGEREKQDDQQAEHRNISVQPVQPGMNAQPQRARTQMRHRLISFGRQDVPL